MKPVDHESQIAEEATACAIAMRGARSSDLPPEVIEWLARSPEHAHHLAIELALDEQVEHLKPSAESIEHWKAVAREAFAQAEVRDAENAPSHDLRPWRVGSSGDAPVREKRWIPDGLLSRDRIAAVLFALLVGLFWAWMQGPPIETYRTTATTAMQIALPDGSSVQLRPGSWLDVRFSSSRRDLWLHEGGAEFTVQRDLVRPFRVSTDRATVEAVGTRFVVERKAQMTRIEVLEGRVHVTGATAAGESTELGSGESAQLPFDGPIDKKPAHVSNATLDVQATPLGRVVEEFNRHNSQPEFVVEESARERLISARIDMHDADELLAVLRAQEGLIVSQKGDVVTVRTRNENTVRKP